MQRALTRLAAQKADTRVSQLVMWNVSAGLDWATIAALSQNWANRFELALARHFVDHLDSDMAADAETGRIHFDISGTDDATEAKAAELRKSIEGQIVLGLRAELKIPSRPEGPSLACRVRMKVGEVQVQLSSSDASSRTWVPFGKFTLPLAASGTDYESLRLADALAEGLLSRLVRAQLVKGPREKGKLSYRIRIDNVSPLRLNGVAALGVGSKAGEKERVLSGISVPPRRSMTVPASEELVKALGLKQGIRVTAIDLSGL